MLNESIKRRQHQKDKIYLGDFFSEVKEIFPASEFPEKNGFDFFYLTPKKREEVDVEKIAEMFNQQITSKISSLEQIKEFNQKELEVFKPLNFYLPVAPKFWSGVFPPLRLFTELMAVSAGYGAYVSQSPKPIGALSLVAVGTLLTLEYSRRSGKKKSELLVDSVAKKLEYNYDLKNALNNAVIRVETVPQVQHFESLHANKLYDKNAFVNMRERYMIHTIFKS